MNKLPRDLENPYDAWILEHTARLLPALRATGCTPNLLTTCRLLCGLWSRWCLWHDRPIAFAFWHHVGYGFDCLDGQMARAYDMVSRVGDIYDHVTDAVLDILLVWIIVRKYGALPPALLLLVGSMLGLCVVAMGCQQRYYHAANPHAPAESLDAPRALCPPGEPERILRWTRLFGTGTWQWFTMSLVLYLHYDSQRRAPP